MATSFNRRDRNDLQMKIGLICIGLKCSMMVILKRIYKIDQKIWAFLSQSTQVWAEIPLIF